MIHTERGLLIDMIEMMERDRLYVAEVLGTGPSGRASQDRSLDSIPGRREKFETRLHLQAEIIRLLRSLL